MRNSEKKMDTAKIQLICLMVSGLFLYSICPPNYAEELTKNDQLKFDQEPGYSNLFIYRIPIGYGSANDASVLLNDRYIGDFEISDLFQEKIQAGVNDIWIRWAVSAGPRGAEFAPSYLELNTIPGRNYFLTIEVSGTGFAIETVPEEEGKKEFPEYLKSSVCRRESISISSGLLDSSSFTDCMSN